MKLLGDNINEGDVILCNHPSCGGSHLPDLTVITPVRFLFVSCLVFFFLFSFWLIDSLFVSLSFPCLFLFICLLSCRFVYFH